MTPKFDPMQRESLKSCPFEKHRGKPWTAVVALDRRYVEWLVSGEGPKLDPDLEETLINLLEAEDETEDTVDQMYGGARDMFDERND